jgi:hypothetical protein
MREEAYWLMYKLSCARGAAGELLNFHKGSLKTHLNFKCLHSVSRIEVSKIQSWYHEDSSDRGEPENDEQLVGRGKLVIRINT